MDNHCIIRVKQTLPGGRVEVVDFNISQEQQNEAIECIQCILESYDVSDLETPDTQERDGVSDLSGPRRIEAVIRKRKTVAPANPSLDEKKILIVGILDPVGCVSYTTLQGRTRYATGYLEPGFTPFKSDEWYVSRLEEFNGLNRTTAAHFGLERQGDSWDRIHDFLKKLTTKEIKTLKAWDPRPSARQDLDYGYGNYYSHTPYVYKPVVGSFRVAGDEIGAKLCLEQAENLIKAELYTVPTMEEFLEKAEKKVEAEEEKPKPNPSSAGTENASGVGVLSNGRQAEPNRACGSGDIPGTANCAYCGQLGCDECEWAYTEGMGALMLGPGYRTVH